MVDISMVWWCVLSLLHVGFRVSRWEFGFVILTFEYYHACLFSFHRSWPKLGRNGQFRGLPHENCAQKASWYPERPVWWSGHYCLMFFLLVLRRQQWQHLRGWHWKVWERYFPAILTLLGLSLLKDRSWVSKQHFHSCYIKSVYMCKNEFVCLVNLLFFDKCSWLGWIHSWRRYGPMLMK